MATKPKVGQIAATKPRFEYVDVDRSQLTGARFYDDSPVVAETEAPESRGALRGVADVGLELGSGAIKGVKFMSDALGADNPVSGALADVNNYVKSLQSAQAKGEDQKIAAIMKEAEDKGVWEQVKAAFSGAGEAPIRQSVGALATGLPIMAASMIPGVREASWGARLATMGSLGAAQGAGIVKSTIYDEVKQRALQEGKSETEAQALASKAQAYSGENFDQIAMGAGLNAAASMTGFQPAVVKAVSGEAGKGAARGLIGSTALGVLKEVPFEAAQGGQEQVAGNVAQDRAGFATPTFRGAVGAMTMEGLLAAPGGAVGGALDYSAPAQLPAPIKTPEQSAADTIRATETVPESGPMTRASNAATEAKAQAIEAGAPLVDEQATAEPMPEPVDDPVRDQILALPDGARQDALRAYAVVNRTDVAKGVQQYNRKLLDRLLTENAPPPVLGERLTETDMGTMLGGGGMTGNADPLAGALGMGREAQANSITNVANVAERRPPMPASDAARMLDEARNRGLDLAVAEHPAGGFVLVPPNWVTPDMAAQGEARLNETIARMQQADAAPVERAPRTRTDGVGLNLQTDPVQNYLDNLRGVNTPAARAYVRDFDAGRITPSNVQQRMVAEKGKTPDQRIAQAAAEAPAQTDPVADRLARAAAQGAAVPAPTDILNPVGLPFKTRMAADRAAKQTPGAVVPVEGGFVVRPQEPVNVQDVPQAPEVPQAAPVVSQPGQAPQAVGAQPAGPAAGVPAEGAGAVEAAGLPPRGREGYDTPVTLDAASLKALVEKTRGTPLVDKPEKLEAWRNGTAKTDPAKFPIELAITPDGRLDVNDGRHRIALAAERGETVEAFIDGKDAQYARQLVSQPSQPQGAASVATPDQAQQAATQPTQAGAAQPTQGLTDAATAQNNGAQGTPAPGAQAQAPGNANWAALTPEQRRRARLEHEIATGQTNNGGVVASLRPSAIEKRKQELAELPPVDVAGVGGATPTATPGAQPAAPIRLGRNNTPLNEGGKPFKTRKAAGDAKKLQPMMRVVTVPGGYALAEKTPAQLAAEERAAKRLRTPRTSPAGEPVPAHAFIAASGGLHMRHRNDLGVDGNPRIGNRRLFGGLNRGLSIEQATEMLVADGYLSEGASHNDAYALIKKSLSQPQYNADGIERIAQAESDAQFEDYMAAQEEAADEGDMDPFDMTGEFTSEELDDVGYTSASPALQAEVNALIAQADAIDIDTYAILEDIARTYANATQDQYNAAARDALAAAIARSNQDGGSVAAQAAPAAEPAAEQGLNQPAALTQQAQAATESVAQTVSKTVEMPPTRQQESSPFARFATGRYRIAIRDEGNGQYAEVVAIQRGSGVEIEMRMPGEALEHPAFSQLNARAQALFETPTASMFDAEPPALELAAQTPAEAAARQDAQEQADKAEAAAKRAEEADAKAEEERKRIAQASVRAADRFELGQDPMDSLTGQGGLAFSFAGARAATADKHALVTAQDRLSAGEDAETVRRETGWFKGADGKWRYEISDKDASMKIGRKGTPLKSFARDLVRELDRPLRLSDVLDHPALFAAYPALQDHGVTFVPAEVMGPTNGSFSGELFTLNDALAAREALSTLLHEIQHGIQDIEGFATGGTPERFGSVYVEELRQRLKWQAAHLRSAQKNGGIDPVSGQDENTWLALARETANELGKHTGKNDPRYIYASLAGEVEARNTQARQGMTDAQRRATPPNQTADVADSEVIVVFNGKEMQNAPAPVNAEQRLADAKQRLGTPVDPYRHKLQAIQAARKQAANVVQADNGQWLLAPKAEPYTAQEARDAQQRIDKLNRALKKHNNVTPAAVLSDAPTPAMAWGRSIARTLGYNVTFIQPNPDFHGVAVGGDAFVSASADHPAIGLIGHEVLHSFKQSSPDIYQALAERIRPYLKDGVVDAKRRWEDANGGRDTSMAHAEEEVLADLNGAMWLDPKFWREMAKNDQSLFRQVAYKFMEVATKAMQGLSRFKADSLVTDVDAVREIIAQEWAYQAQEMGNPSEFSETDGPAFSRTPGDQTQTDAFKRWFGDSKAVDADGKPLVLYHGTDDDISVFDESKSRKGFWFSSDDSDASDYGDNTVEAYLSLKNPAYFERTSGDKGVNEAISIAKSEGYDGLIVTAPEDGDASGMYWPTNYVAFRPEQIKSATGNSGAFDPANPDIRFSRTTDAAKAVGDTLKSITVANVKKRAGFKLTDYLGIGLQALGRRQIVDIYGDLLPLTEYNRLVQQMEADKNEGGAEADQLVTSWAKLDDEAKLADLMHEATLAQIDPGKPFADGDDKGKFLMLERKFKLLSDEAKAVYRDTRDAYKAHHAKVRSAIKERIERSEINGERKAALLKQMDDEFFAAVKGVYFPLARFGQYAVTVKGPDGKVESVSRAETKAEAEALRNNLLSAFPRDKGFTVGRVMLSKDFIADRDAVGRGFMTELYQVLDKQDMDAAQRAELEDTLGQLYLSSLPDLSWAKHGIHRKGTPGFSQDARRAFAQNMFHGARYLAKLRYSDLMQDELGAMQKHVDDWREVEDFDQNSAQRVVTEMYHRHESLMNPKSNKLSTWATSLGFVFHLGLSPASAMVNLSQTALVAYPIMGAKWGFGKASAALLKASAEAAKGKNDITGSLNADERAAYDEAVRAGTIDVTMAHDLAGIAQGEDAGVMWKIRPVMRWASFLFHHAERFNRQVTFVAAYRLAREAGADHKAAFEQATKATYDGHFDYSAANKARIMQGNVAKVLLLFKQYGQNMVYTLARNAQQAIKGESPEVRAQARKALGGLLATHAAAAGVLGLPMVTTLLAAASMIGGDDDEPWDAKVALQNMLADTFGQKPAEVLAHGLSRLTPWDISGRVGLDRLIFPDVQEGLEGQRLWESAATQALGPVGGIFGGALKGLDLISDGHYKLGLEAMLPAVLRQAVKSVRYATDGAQDKSGVSIKDEVSTPAVVGQLLGFSPSEVRLAQEGKSAIYQQDKALAGRRQELLTKAARATMAKDAEARAEAMKDIQRFNQKNPTRRITPLNVLQSVRNSQRRIDQAEGGVYLPKNRRDAIQAGRFALAESE